MPPARCRVGARLQCLHRLQPDALLFLSRREGTDWTHARVPGSIAAAEGAANLVFSFRIAAVGNNPAFACLCHEVEKLAADRTESRLCRFFQGLLRIQPAFVKQLERAFHFVAFRLAESGAA